MEPHRTPVGMSADGDKAGVGNLARWRICTVTTTVLNPGSPMSLPGKGHGTCPLCRRSLFVVHRSGRFPSHELIAIAAAAAALSGETDTRWGREPNKDPRAMILSVSRFGV